MFYHERNITFLNEKLYNEIKTNIFKPKLNDPISYRQRWFVFDPKTIDVIRTKSWNHRFEEGQKRQKHRNSIEN